MTNIEKQFVPHEQSLKLRELGFDEECLGYYNKEGKLRYQGQKEPLGMDTEEMSNSVLNSKYCSAALFQQVFDWFRDRKSLISYIKFTMGYGWDAHSYQICDTTTKMGKMSHVGEMGSYEEARIACLDKLIELCQKNESVKEPEVEENIIPISTNEMKCVECNFLPAKYDYNGCGHWVCKPCGDSLEKEFEEEYR